MCWLLQQDAAASGRLCVETAVKEIFLLKRKAAAFGRLCVETQGLEAIDVEMQ